MEIKQQLLMHCLKKVEERIEEIRIASQQAQEAIESDTKSSAGDKYETSREMIQQDLSRYGMQLEQAKKEVALLRSIREEEQDRIGLGAVVETDQATYFIAVSLGPVQVGTRKIMVVSPASPIGQLLLAAAIDGQIIFNGKEQHIKSVY